MEKEKTYYKNGIELALNQMYSKDIEYTEKANEIRGQYGETAYSEFMRGYYEALLFFTHAINHFKNNPEHIKEQLDNISKSHGEEMKKVFLMGINYYQKLDSEKECEQRKK